MRRRRLVHLALALCVAAGPTGCAEDQSFRKVDLNEVNRYLAPYGGFNFEFNLFGIDLMSAGGFGAGFEILELNLFYALALGVYGRIGLPSIKTENEAGGNLGWVASGGLIYQPVPTWTIKPYLMVGAGAMSWSNPTGNDSSSVTPAIEGSIGLATAFHYRVALDFYIAKGFGPDASEEPPIMGARLKLIGFSFTSFVRPPQGMHPTGQVDE